MCRRLLCRFGWQQSFIVPGVIGIAFSVVVVMLIHDRPEDLFDDKDKDSTDGRTPSTSGPVTPSHSRRNSDADEVLIVQQPPSPGVVKRASSPWKRWTLRWEDVRDRSSAIAQQSALIWPTLLKVIAVPQLRPLMLAYFTLSIVRQGENACTGGCKCIRVWRSRLWPGAL